MATRRDSTAYSARGDRFRRVAAASVLGILLFSVQASRQDDPASAGFLATVAARAASDYPRDNAIPVAGLATAAAALGPAVAKSDAIIVDDLDRWVQPNCLVEPCPGFGFKAYGEDIYWRENSRASDVVWEGHALWTGGTSNVDQSTNSAIWATEDVDGEFWEVLAFVPQLDSGRPATRKARYCVGNTRDQHLADAPSERLRCPEIVIDQVAAGGQWVSLGEFEFPEGYGYVTLSDIVDDGSSLVAVLFDAVKWVRVGAPVEVDSYLDGYPDGSTFQPGQRVTFCFSVSRPVHIRWLWWNPTNGWTLITEFDDDGRGQCRLSDPLSGSGLRRIKIEAVEGTTILDFDETLFYVDAPCVNNSELSIPPAWPLTAEPGKTLSLDFTIRNVGTCMWRSAESYKLVNTAGAYGANAQQSLSREVAPGSDTQFSIVLTAPNSEGSFESKWRMSVGDTRFGQEIVAPFKVARRPCSSFGGDSDKDGLCDDWESHGYRGIDLPKMGADPQRKDIFVELDYFADSQPKIGIVNKLAEAFARQNIQLHIDLATTFGSYGRSNKISGNGSISIEEFQAIKHANFDSKRIGLFHYALSVAELRTKSDGNSLGIGENPFVPYSLDGKPGDDLIIAIANAPLITQAGILMHELGHNLGLSHGGTPDRSADTRALDNTLNKPNHLSVMNYALGYRGLIYKNQEGYLDYARYDLAELLDENDLDERIGLNGGTRIEDYGTRWFCPADQVAKYFKWPPSGFTKKANGPIDWDCFLGASGRAKNDINGDLKLQTLRGFAEWDRLVFTGGDITGGLLSLTSDSTNAVRQVLDPPFEPPLELGDQLVSPYWLVLETAQTARIEQGKSAEHEFTVFNKGTQDDTYRIDLSSADTTVAIIEAPRTVTVPAGAARTIRARLGVSAITPPGTQIDVIAEIESTSSPSITDSELVRVVVLDRPAIPDIYLPLLARSSDLQRPVPESATSTPPPIAVTPTRVPAHSATPMSTSTQVVATPPPSATETQPPTPPTDQFQGSFCDRFDGTVLDPRWRRVDPFDSMNVRLDPSRGLVMSVPDGDRDLYGSNRNAARVMQPVPSFLINPAIQWTVETRARVEFSGPDFQSVGLLYWNDQDNYVWIGPASDGTVGGISQAASGRKNVPWRGPNDLLQKSVFLRFQLQSENFDDIIVSTLSAGFSFDGSQWTNSSFSLPIEFTSEDALVGPVVVNTRASEPLTAEFDDFLWDFCR